MKAMVLEQMGPLEDRPWVQELPLEQAHEALLLVKQGKTQGAAVLRISPEPL